LLATFSKIPSVCFWQSKIPEQGVRTFFWT